MRRVLNLERKKKKALRLGLKTAHVPQQRGLESLHTDSLGLYVQVEVTCHIQHHYIYIYINVNQ